MAKTLGVISIGAGIAFLLLHKKNTSGSGGSGGSAPGGQQHQTTQQFSDSTQQNQQNLQTNPAGTGPSTLPEYTPTQSDYQAVTTINQAFSPFIPKAAFDTTKPNGPASSKWRAYFTGWDLLNGPQAKDSYGNPQPYFQPSVAQMLLYAKDWTPDSLWANSKDAVTVLGNILGTPFSPAAPISHDNNSPGSYLSDSNVNWSNLSSRPDIEIFITGAQYHSFPTIVYLSDPMNPVDLANHLQDLISYGLTICFLSVAGSTPNLPNIFIPLNPLTGDYVLGGIDSLTDQGQIFYLPDSAIPVNH